MQCFEQWKNEAGTLVILIVLASLITALLVGSARAAGVGGDPYLPDPETRLIAIETPEGDVVKFADIENRCLEVGGIRFGARQPWTGCRLLSSRFVSTIGLLDFYHAQYCLVRKGGSKCDRQAMLVFANRAYRDDATLVMLRMDPAGTAYDGPLVTGQGPDNLMVMSVKQPGKPARMEYRYWNEARWNVLPASVWKDAVLAHLGQGARIVGSVNPAAHNLSTSARIALPGRQALESRVEFSFEGGRVLVKRITRGDQILAQAGQTADGRHVH